MSEWQLFNTEGLVVSTFYSKKDKKWVSYLRDPKTGRFIKKLRNLTVVISMNIETERGRQPLVVEIVAMTMIVPVPAEYLSKFITRIVNAAVKALYILFDAPKDMKGLPKMHALREEWFKLAKTHTYTSERTIDRFLRRVQGYGGFTRPLDEYFCRESILKAGIEIETRETDAPPYPNVRFMVFKKPTNELIKTWTIRLRPRIVFDMLKIMQIRLSWEVRESWP